MNFITMPQARTGKIGRAIIKLGDRYRARIMTPGRLNGALRKIGYLKDTVEIEDGCAFGYTRDCWGMGLDVAVPGGGINLTFEMKQLTILGKKTTPDNIKLNILENIWNGELTFDHANLERIKEVLTDVSTNTTFQEPALKALEAVYLRILRDPNAGKITKISVIKDFEHGHIKFEHIAEAHVLSALSALQSDGDKEIQDCAQDALAKKSPRRPDLNPIITENMIANTGQGRISGAKIGDPRLEATTKKPAGEVNNDALYTKHLAGKTVMVLAEGVNDAVASSLVVNIIKPYFENDPANFIPKTAVKKVNRAIEKANKGKSKDQKIKASFVLVVVEGNKVMIENIMDSDVYAYNWKKESEDSYGQFGRFDSKTSFRTRLDQGELLILTNWDSTSFNRVASAAYFKALSKDKYISPLGFVEALEDSTGKNITAVVLQAETVRSGAADPASDDEEDNRATLVHDLEADKDTAQKEQKPTPAAGAPGSGAAHPTMIRPAVVDADAAEPSAAKPGVAIFYVTPELGPLFDEATDQTTLKKIMKDIRFGNIDVKPEEKRSIIAQLNLLAVLNPSLVKDVDRTLANVLKVKNIQEE